MMRHLNKMWLVLIGIAIFISSCGNSTGPDPEDAPELPELVSEEVKPDLSFFEDNQPKMMKGDTANYYAARNAALFSSFTFSSIEFYSGFMTTSEEEAEYNDGVWEWHYSYSFEGSSFEMLMTAEERDDDVLWQLFWSFDDGEGNSVENYKILEGTYSRDGTEGEWRFNSLDTEGSEVLAYKSSWQILSDDQKNITVEMYDDAGVASTTFEYQANVPEYTMTVTYHNSSQSDMEIFWNTETKTGYISKDGDKRCWDENFQDTTCM